MTARRSAARLARTSSSGKLAATRWGRTSSRSVRALALLAVAALPARTAWPFPDDGLRATRPGGAGRAGSGDDPRADPDFRRALALLQDPSPERRQEGEKAIRAMGRRGVNLLKAWIARADGDLERARALLQDLDGAQTGDDPLSPARPFLSRALSGAWARFHAGDYREARRTAEAVLQLDPDSPELWQLRRLIRQCEERRIQKELLEPTVEFRELVYAVDAVPRVLFRLVNHSPGPVGVRAERGILGTIQVTYKRKFLDGSERNDEKTVAIRTASGEERVGLQPGASYEREIAITIDEPRLPRGMALRIRVVGKFQPSQWGLEEKNLSRTLSLPPAECWVVAPSEMPLAEAPLKKLESALFFRDLHSFFTGGQLSVWAAEDDPLLNQKLLKVLVDSLPDLDETGVRVADPLLEDASGVKRDRNLSTQGAIVAHWQRWWADRSRRQKEARDSQSPLQKFLDR